MDQNTDPYRAAPGHEDRDGEMTGAISINMMITMLPVTIWCIWVGPLFFANVWIVVATGILLGVVLTFAGLPVSRRIWTWFSAWSDGK